MVKDRGWFEHLWLAITLFETVTMAANWMLWLRSRDLRRQYSPEVLRAAHVSAKVPRMVFLAALIGAIVSVLMWTTLITRAVIRERLEESDRHHGRS